MSDQTTAYEVLMNINKLTKKPDREDIYVQEKTGKHFRLTKLGFYPVTQVNYVNKNKQLRAALYEFISLYRSLETITKDTTNLNNPQAQLKSLRRVIKNVKKDVKNVESLLFE